MKSTLPSQTSELRNFPHAHLDAIDGSISSSIGTEGINMSLLRPPSCRIPIRASHRAFSTTTSRPVSLQIDRNNPEKVADTVPEYPHGPARWYKQSNKGLYGGQRIQFGNNVSGDFNTKTRRTFQVNVLTKRLWSHALDRFVQVRVSARTLRTIDRVGGLDEYLLGDKAARIKQLGVSGWWLRWAIMQQPAVKRRFEKERRDLGLAALEEVESKLAALEEANAAQPEQDEAEAALELEQAMPEESEEHQVNPMDASSEVEDLKDMEASSSDDSVFAVTSPPDLPPLKFRVDRKTHVVLTRRGWVRTRPDRVKYAKKWIASHKFPTYVSDKMAEFEAELTRLREEEMPEMGVLEEREMRNAAKQAFLKDLEGKVEWAYAEGHKISREKGKIKSRLARRVAIRAMIRRHRRQREARALRLEVGRRGEPVARRGVAEPRAV